MSKSTLLYLLMILAAYAGFAYGVASLADTWNLPFTWGVFAVQAAVGITGALVLDPELLKERIRPQGKDRDPMGRLILGLLCAAHFGLPAYDIGHLHVADNIPVFAQATGLLVCTAAWPGFLWSMKANKFFSSAIRLQPDRGQTVVSSGPYKFIRHPGYAFASLAFLSEGVALGSWLAVLPAVLIAMHLFYRTVLEERMLSEDLPGYADYAQKVRYRWLPFVW